MFNSSIPPRKDKARIAAEASNVFADMLADLLIEADVPEEQKIGVRICKQAHQIHKAVSDIVERFADSERCGDAAEAFETRKQVLEYLSLVEVGLKQFMETIKLPNEI